MKRIILSAIFVVSAFTSFAQTLNYNDLGVLYSKNNNFGSARFEAMSGAFGALGGDLSSINVNPAGMAVATRGGASISLGGRSLSTDTDFYENKGNYQDQFLNLSQVGGTLVFGSSNEKTNWNRYALTFNYSKKADFGGGYVAGNQNGKNPNFTEYFIDNYVYDRSLEQRLSTSTSGSSGVFNLGFAANYDNKLYLGGSLNFHNFDFSQVYVLNEKNEDVNKNVLAAKVVNDSYIEGNGFSLGLGLIYKVHSNIRLGLAFETPTWYGEIIDEYNEEVVDGNGDYIEDPMESEVSAYRFKTPSSLTVSGAYVFGKQGLISFDYIYKNYKRMKYLETDDGFTDANQKFDEFYKGTHAVNIGTEWRFDKVSVRGGYHFEQSNANFISDNPHGFSLGAGYKFGYTKLDLSYRNESERNLYKIYEQDDLSVKNRASRITATLTLGF